MKVSNVSLWSGGVQVLDSDLTLTPVYLGNIVLASIQLSFSGTFSGAFSLQCSNDEGRPNIPGKASQSDTVSNWTDIDGSAVSVTEPGNHTWNLQNIGFLWLRVQYTHISGSGLLTSARVTLKGV